MATTPDEIVIRYYCDLLAHGERDAADEILAPDYVDRGPGADGRNGFLDRLETIQAAFRNRMVIVEDVMVSGDEVLVRWCAGLRHTGEFLGFEPTGEQIDVSGTDVFRIADGRIAERWNHESGLGLVDALFLRAARASAGSESLHEREPAVGAVH
jgi:predicted ester cyclase